MINYISILHYILPHFYTFSVPCFSEPSYEDIKHQVEPSILYSPGGRSGKDSSAGQSSKISSRSITSNDNDNDNDNDIDENNDDNRIKSDRSNNNSKYSPLSFLHSRENITENCDGNIKIGDDFVTDFHHNENSIRKLKNQKSVRIDNSIYGDSKDDCLSANSSLVPPHPNTDRLHSNSGCILSCDKLPQRESIFFNAGPGGTL